MYNLCHVLHGDVVHVAVSGLNEHFYLRMEVSDHVCLVFFLRFRVVINVDEHANFRVTVKEFTLDHLPYEITQQFVSFLGVVILIIDTVSVLFKQVVGFGVVDEFGVDFLHFVDVRLDVTYILFDVGLVDVPRFSRIPVPYNLLALLVRAEQLLHALFDQPLL